MLNLPRGWFYALCALLAAGLLVQIGLLGYTAATVTSLAAPPPQAITAVAAPTEPDFAATVEAEQAATITAEAEQLATAEAEQAEQTATAEAEQTATAEAE